MKKHTIIAILLMGSVPAASFGDLPGLHPGATGTNEVRNGGPQKSLVVTQAGPVRGSLFRQGTVAAAPVGPDGEPAVGVSAAPVSFIAVAPGQPKRYKKNDIITVIIREDSDSTTNGKANSKKTQDFDLALQEFLQLAISSSGLPEVGKVGTPSQLPEIKFKYSNDRQSDAQQGRQDSLSARISAMIVDVKPNGTMVIEAVKQIVVDKEEQVFKLSGVCRVEDISIDNTLLSTQLANLSLSKQTKGEVRDGTKRGWLNQFIDKWNPF